MNFESVDTILLATVYKRARCKRSMRNDQHLSTSSTSDDEEAMARPVWWPLCLLLGYLPTP
eukprot:6175385-Pleurochrysis_carterae.AAC.5